MTVEHAQVMVLCKVEISGKSFLIIKAGSQFQRWVETQKPGLVFIDYQDKSYRYSDAGDYLKIYVKES